MIDIVISYPTLIAFTICIATLAYYLSEDSSNIAEKILYFMVYILTFSVFGFLSALLIIIILTFVYQSPQGPLLIISHGAYGIAIGEILGLYLWIRGKVNRQ